MRWWFLEPVSSSGWNVSELKASVENPIWTKAGFYDHAALFVKFQIKIHFYSQICTYWQIVQKSLNHQKSMQVSLGSRKKCLFMQK